MAYTFVNIALIASTVFIASEPPVLPIADVTDRSISILNSHMIKAPEISVEDYKVFQQIHINHMKYEMMKELMHKIAEESKPGESISASNLDNIFDDADRDFDEAIEKWIREERKIKLENQRREIDEKIKEIDKSNNSDSLKKNREI